MNILLLILIGISLSMDAFSFSLSLGTFNISKEKILKFTIMVGIFHFFMPFIGSLLGASLERIVQFNHEKIIFIIFLFIALEMFISIFSKEDKEYKINFMSMLLYAFSVSLDSLTIGIGINRITEFPVLGFVIFSITSSIFTFIGLNIGACTFERYGIVAKVIGFIIMLALAILHFFK